MHEDSPQTLARSPGVHGELAVRRRVSTSGTSAYELIVNGVFLMDTAETSSECLLADVFLDRHPVPRRVLVGGLGFGLTVQVLLADAQVEQVDVIEVEPQLVAWLCGGLVPGVDTILADPRVTTIVADVRDALAEAEPASYDGVLLDVDNGPDFLVHDRNAAMYEGPALRAAHDTLRDDGVLAVWSSTPATRLSTVLTDVMGSCDMVERTVGRGGREVTYYVYVATK